MIHLPGKSRSPIGIDLGSYAIKAVQLVRAGRGGWRLHSGAAIDLPVPNHPFDAHTATYLRDVLCRQGFLGDDVVVGAPTAQLAMEVLEVPPRSSGAPIEQIVRSELARAAKLEDEPFELECWDLPSPGRGSGNVTSVMAVALKHSQAQALLDPFENEGFNVVALDTTSWALARAVAPYAAAPDGIAAVLNIGYGSSEMVLVNDGVVIYQRVLHESGLGMVLRSLREEFDFADDEASFLLQHGTGTPGSSEDSPHARQVTALIGRYLDSIVAEIQPAFDYASHRYAEKPLSGLLLAGGGSAVAGIAELLKARLSLDVSILSPDRIVECPPALAQRCGNGVLTAALGLALHGAK